MKNEEFRMKNENKQTPLIGLSGVCCVMRAVDSVNFVGQEFIPV